MKSVRFNLSRVQHVILYALIAIAAGCITMAINAQTVSGNGTGTNNGFYYSLYSSGGSATMTLGSAGNYSMNWSNVSDIVGGKGWNPGSAQAISYNVGSASNYNNISIYGWLENPLVEYYICEFGSLYTGDATEKGSVTSDGHTYTTYEHQQVNQPSIQGTTTFEQYLDNWGGSSMGSDHTVTTSNHFNHWSSLGMSVGSFNYQILGTESYSGGSGSVNATVWAGSTTTSNPSFTLASSASTLSVSQGSSATDTVTVTGQNGFSGSVTLAASGLPSGVTASFGTNPTTGSSVVTFTASSSAAAGASTVTITGTSGSLSAKATIALTVTAPSLPAYSITTGAKYTVVNEASGLCVNDTGGATSNGTAVEQESCSSGDLSQEWLFTSVGTNSWEITTANLAGAAWNVIGPSTTPGTGIQLYTYYSGALNMQFEAFKTASGYAELIDENSGLCLNFPNTNSGQQMQINTCNGSTSEEFELTPVSATSGSFTLSDSASSLSVTQGSSATDSISVTPENGFTGSVSFTATGLPSGVTASFSPTSSTSSSALTLTASSTATTGTSTVTITGTSGSTTATTTIALTVNAKTTSGFSLSPSASTLTVAQGASGTDTIAVTEIGGFTGSVAFTASGLPSGVTASFSPTSSTSSSVLTLTASSTAAAGAYTVTVTGTSGSTTASTTFTLDVTSSGGSSACTVDYTITSQWTGGFGAAVTIVNGGSTTLSNWTLTWSFANGQTISGSWNGNVSQSGANVTVSEQSGQSWQNIPAGGSYSGFGFNGTWNNAANAIPTNFALNGTACTVN